MAKPITVKKELYKGRFNTVYAEYHRNGSVTLSDDFGVKFHVEKEQAEMDGYIRYVSAETFDNMEYLNPVEDFDEDGLYGA